MKFTVMASNLSAYAGKDSRAQYTYLRRYCGLRYSKLIFDIYTENDRAIIYREYDENKKAYAYRLLGREGTVNTITLVEAGNEEFQSQRVDTSGEEWTEANELNYQLRTLPSFDNFMTASTGTELTFNYALPDNMRSINNSRVTNMFHPYIYSSVTPITNDKRTLSFGKIFESNLNYGVNEYRNRPQVDGIYYHGTIAPAPACCFSEFSVFEKQSIERDSIRVRSDVAKRIPDLDYPGTAHSLYVQAMNEHAGINYTESTSSSYSGSYRDATYSTDFYGGFYGFHHEIADDWTAYDQLIFLDIPITDDLEQAQRYIDTGIRPDRSAMVPSDEPPIYPDSPEDKDLYDVDNQKYNTPTHGVVKDGSTKYYVMTNAGLKSFVEWFWSDSPSFTEWLENKWDGLYNNLSNYIIGAYYFPVEDSLLYGDTQQKEIIIGKFGTGINAQAITEVAEMKQVASVDLTSSFFRSSKSFLDLEPYTKYQVYLPYLGVIDIPTHVISNFSKLIVNAVVDVPTMQMLYSIMAETSGRTNAKHFIIFESATPIGEQVPMVLESGIETTSGHIDSLVNTVTSVALSTASAGAMAGEVGMTAGTKVGLVSQGIETASSEMHNSVPSPSAIGSAGGVMGKYGGTDVYIIKTKSIPVEPSNYAHIYGRPLYEEKNLGDLDGFTVVENPQVSFGHTTNSDDNVVYPTREEIEIIYNLLSKGVYL